jgi:hypothetical protein
MMVPPLSEFVWFRYYCRIVGNAHVNINSVQRANGRQWDSNRIFTTTCKCIWYFHRFIDDNQGCDRNPRLSTDKHKLRQRSSDPGCPWKEIERLNHIVSIEIIKMTFADDLVPVPITVPQLRRSDRTLDSHFNGLIRSTLERDPHRTGRKIAHFLGIAPSTVSRRGPKKWEGKHFIWDGCSLDNDLDADQNHPRVELSKRLPTVL